MSLGIRISWTSLAPGARTARPIPPTSPSDHLGRLRHGLDYPHHPPMMGVVPWGAALLAHAEGPHQRRSLYSLFSICPLAQVRVRAPHSSSNSNSSSNGTHRYTFERLDGRKTRLLEVALFVMQASRVVVVDRHEINGMASFLKLSLEAALFVM